MKDLGLEVTVEHYSDDIEFQGCIKAQSGRWKLLIDKGGFPRLVVRTQVFDKGVLKRGWVALDDLLPEEVTIPGIMTEGLGDLPEGD